MDKRQRRQSKVREIAPGRVLMIAINYVKFWDKHHNPNTRNNLPVPNGVRQRWDKSGTWDKCALNWITKVGHSQLVPKANGTRNYNLFIYLFLSVPMSRCSGDR